MNKKLAAALSGGAVLVLALTGCGGSEDNKELDAWAKKVCDLVPAQNKKITAAYDAITKAAEDTESTPAELQKADSQAFQDLSDGYKARATVISNAGAPPVPRTARRSSRRPSSSSRPSRRPMPT